MMSTTAKVALALMLLGSGSFGARRQQHRGKAVHHSTVNDCDNRYSRLRSKALVPGCVSDWRWLHSARRPQRRRRLLTDVNGA
jgi:hypothetical protein